MKLITQEQQDFYHENGYLIIDDLYPEELILKFENCIRRHANKDFAAIINPDRFDVLKEFDERPKSDVTLEEIKETSKLCSDMLKHKSIIKILRVLQKNDIIGLSTQIIYKEAYSTYSSQAWFPHQDNRYIDNENGQYLTINWLLRGCDPENGGLYVYPGTHKLPLLPAPEAQSFRENVNSNPGRECKIPVEFTDKKVDLRVKKGALIILHGNIIHGSYSNLSHRSRPFYSTCYITKGEYYKTGKNSKRTVTHFLPD